ncbi:unnamed protein product [Paramecium sonneborni]|uniref:Uncharacterized protein n=1 Tax=Paramecium sonneborni TaxID=65129 RepID=A0A8S1L0S3_9CILI|nr:unnamed protein product [Paramecium sonneborni]
MGSSLCFTDSQKSKDELKLPFNNHCKQNGPPNLFKPTPIVKILIFDEQIEKEETDINEQENYIQNDQSISYVAQQSEEIDSNQQRPWIKKTYAIETINVSNFKNDEYNNKNNNTQQKNISREHTITNRRNKFVKQVSNISIQLGQQDSFSNVTYDKNQIKIKSLNRNQ